MTAAPQLAADMSEDEQRLVCWQSGQLWPMLCWPHHAADYHAFRRWNVERQSPVHRRAMRAKGAFYDNVWCDEMGRRVGKTGKWLMIGAEESIRRPGCRGLIFTAKQKSIGGIIVPLAKKLFADAPLGYRPEYKGTHGADHEGLWFPATESFIKLVGVDTHPDATRGQFLDWAVGSEAAFIKGLDELLTGNIVHQFQMRPWAWLALESSTGKAADCDFNRIFREDAKLRGTYRMKTIRDNPMLTEEEVETEEARSGGADSPACQRELYCVPVRDPEDSVVPEFNEIVHVVPPGKVPDYAHAYVGMDPGMRDPLGLVWGFWDFERAKLVLQSSFAERNCSTARAAVVMKERERALWGTEHRDAEADDAARLAWLTGRTDVQPEKAPLQAAAGATLTGDGRLWHPPEGALVYWDDASEQFKPNPYVRISDVDPRMVGDLLGEHGISFGITAKDDAEAQLNAVRNMFRLGKIEVWDTPENQAHLVPQLRSGQWNEKRTDWDRTPTLGHLDCLAALIYLLRNVNRGKNPTPPKVIDRKAANLALLPWHKEDRRGGNVQPMPAVRDWRTEDLPDPEGGGRKWR